MKKKFKLISAILLSIMLTGCWDRVELEEQGYVIAIGVDKGEKGLYSVTYQIARSESSGGGGFFGGGGASGSGAGMTSEIVTISAPEFLSGRDLITASVPRKLNFSHTRILVVSEELARSKYFPKVAGATLRERQVRRNMYIAISREKAADFLRGNTPKMEAEPHKFFDYSSRRWRETGLTPISTLNEFMQRLEMGTDLLLTIYGSTKITGRNEYGEEAGYLPGEIDKQGGNPVQIIGSAVIKNGKMINAITGDETRLILMMRPSSKVNNMLITFPDPLDQSSRISAQLIKNMNTKVKVKLDGQSPEIDVTVPITLKVLSIASYEDYVEDLDKQRFLKKYFEDYMAAKGQKLVKKTQDEFKGDPFLWSLSARKKFLTLEDFLNYNWPEKYLNAKVSIHFNAELTDFGKRLSPPGFKYIK